MPTVPQRYFEASDAGLRDVRPTWWGAVVTDDRFPDVYDLNYARVTAETSDLGLAEVLADLEPALRWSGSRHVQIVILHPDGAPDLVEQAVRAGLRPSADSVMEFRGTTAPVAEGDDIEDADPADPAFVEVLRQAYREFEVTRENVVAQLLRWNREVLAPAGRRYFVARREGAVAGMGAVHVAGDIAYVDDVVTFPEQRRRGVASAIVRRALREAAAAGAESTFLLADEPDPIRLYRSLGFEETGRVRSLLGPTSWATVSPV